MSSSITIIDNRTGDRVDVPIVDGTVDAVAHGVCRIAWKDGTRSEVLLADATAMLVPVVAV